LDRLNLAYDIVDVRWRLTSSRRCYRCLFEGPYVRHLHWE
jgi:hypothetical protein